MKTKTIRHGFAVGMIAGMCFAGAAARASDNDQFGLGVEGFFDNYQEPTATVNSKAEYGSITADYSHNWNAFFAALDGRASYGFDDYRSDSGTADNIPQWEFEGRVRGGYSFRVGGGGLSPYTGVGTRYYWDELKGVITNLGAQGYDRKITQVYIPFGVTYFHQLPDGWTIMPNLEYDQLVWGQVSSRLGTLSGFNNVINTQSNGWGMRGSVMFGFGGDGVSNTWQAGPFFRYWDISDSNLSNAGAFIGLEPENTRMQVGMALRYMW